MPLSFAYPQDNFKVDSLTHLLSSQSDEQKFQTLILLAIGYVDKDNNQSINFIDQAGTLANQLGDTIKIVKAARLKGQLLRRSHQLDEAIEVFKKHLPIAQRNALTQDYIMMLNSLALAYTDRGKYDKALEYHFQSLNIREKNGNKGEISISLDNIGLVYYNLNDYVKAKEYFERSVQLKKEIIDPDNLAGITINLGHCYKALQEPDKAKKYFIEGLKLCQDDCPVTVKIDGEYGLGATFFAENDLDAAEYHLNKSLVLSLAANDKRFQSENLLLLAKIDVKKNEYDSALSKLKVAEAVAGSSHYNKLLHDIYSEFATVFKLRQDYVKASYYQDKFIQLKDSLFSSEQIKDIASIQAKLEERENIKTIASRDEEIARQRKLNIAVFIIAVLLSLLGFMLYRSNQARRKANEHLDNEVKAATKDLQAANQLLEEVNQELDHFIYKTSHDIRGPLATLKGLCNVALTDVADPTALGYLNKLDYTASTLDTLLTRLQKINQINNASLQISPIDFHELVNEIEILEKRKGLPPRLSIIREIQDDIIFNSDRELVMLILENLIANAIKFYNASEKVDPFVKISIAVNGNNLLIRVIDNGIGIGESNPEELFQIFVRASERSASGGIGLYLSRRATHKLHGDIDLHTTENGYTEVVVSLPI